jgi:hypothetical protein
MFGYTTTTTTAPILHIGRGHRFMGGLSMPDRLITGITGLAIVRRLPGIVRMGRTSRGIARRRTMEGVRRILEMEAGLLGMETAGIGRGMETGPDLLGMEMEAGLDRPGMAGILEMGVGLVPLATVVVLGRPEMVEAAGPQRFLLGRHRHHVLLLLLLLVLHLRLGLLQRLQAVLLRVVLLREDLIQGIRRVVRSRRNGLSRRLVRGRVDLAGITMARRRGRRVIAAKPVLVAVGVREVNRNEAFQA